MYKSVMTKHTKDNKLLEKYQFKSAKIKQLVPLDKYKMSNYGGKAKYIAELVDEDDTILVVNNSEGITIDVLQKEKQNKFFKKSAE